MRGFVTLIITILLTSPTAPCTKVQWVSTRMTVVATAYCPCSICCGRFADGLTSTGRSAWKAGIAVDPSVISLGSRLDIPGYTRGPNENGSWIIADDTGSSIVGHRIDVRFVTHNEALEWGRKEVIVRVWVRKRVKQQE